MKLTDRQRVEAGIVPALIFGVCHGLKDLQETEDQKARHEKVTSAALAAMVDSANDMEPKRAAQIYRRTEREYLTLASILEGASNAQAMMAVYYLLEGLLQEERLSIYADSDFGGALQIYMEAIDGFFGEARLDAAAQKRARKLREKLEKEGYFK